MKKFLLLAAAALMLFACNKEDEVSVAKKGNAKFYAITETTTPGTKVYTDEDLKVLWNAGDQISIFNKTTANDQYVFNGDDGANAGGFNPVVENTGDSNLDYVYAIYPYSQDNAINEAGSEITVNLPATQAYREHSFGLGANTMVAVANDNKLLFKNACGYLKFRFYGDNNVTVKSISFEGNKGEKIAGKAIVTPVFGGTPTVTMQSDATEKITIDCEQQPVTLGADSDNATEFIFVIPETTLNSGFTVLVTDVNGKVFEKAYKKSFTITRNRMEKMAAMKVKPTLSRYERVTFDDMVDDGDYVLAYHDAEGFKLFSFNKTMANAETAAQNVANVHGLSALLAKSSEIYATVVGKNYVIVEGEESADYLNISEDIEADAMLSVTGNYNAANLTLASGSYSLRLDKVITSINSDFSAVLSVQPNAPDAINIMYALRGGKVVITFDEMIDFAVAQAQKEGVSFTPEQVDRLRSGFEHLCVLAKDLIKDKMGKDLMTINLSTNVFDVIAQYYDNAADYSLQLSGEKKFGWATPVGFYKGDDGFTANIALPQAGWFDRIQSSLHYQNGTKDDFVAYWATIDPQYSILEFENFFQRLARRFANEIDQSTFELLQDVDFSAIGRVYARYANRFNDQLEPVYLYKKVK